MPSMDSNKNNWFHGKAPRSQVEELVKKAGADGSFAVRTSESVPGGYTISLLFTGRVYTYRVIPTEGKYAIETNTGVQKKMFLSVDEMITEYRKPSNGLACGLINPVGKSPSFFQRIKPDLPIRRPATTRTQSALTMPLPPIPDTPPPIPPYSFPTSPKPVTIPPPISRINSPGSSIGSGFNPAGILAAVSGTNPTAPPVGVYASPSQENQVTAVSPTAPALPPRYEDIQDKEPPPPSEPSPSVNQEPENTESSKTCVVCLDADINAFFQSCGHVCCCIDCSKKIKECPLCRKKISKYHKAYIP